MKIILKNSLAVVSSIFFIFLSLPLGRPDTNSDSPKSEFVGEPAYSLLSDDIEKDIYKN